MNGPRRSARALGLVMACTVALSGCSALSRGSGQAGVPSPSVADGEELTVPSPSATWDDLGTAPDRQHLDDATQPDVPGFTTAPEGQGLQRYLNQQVTWGQCGPLEGADADEQAAAAGDQCATVIAPLDWTNPDGQAITLAMRIRPAADGPTDEDLFVNPGGPGGSAQDFVTYVDTTGLENYNIVGVDPRGSGESTPVVCGDQAQTDAYENADWSPDDQAETDALLAVNKDFAAQCRAGSGALLDHVTSIENAYDMDLVRILLGQDKLNWFGVSYGTWLGAVYAELYPGHVGRMVLDSAVNITDKDSVRQVDGFEQALEAFAGWCAGDSSCTLGSSKDAVLAAVAGLLDGLDGQPLTVGNRQLTQTLAANGILGFLYGSSDVYPDLARTIGSAIAGNGSALLHAADSTIGRGDDGYEQTTYSFPAIDCADATDKGVDQAVSDWKESSGSDSVLGRAMGLDLTCPLWSTDPAPQIRITAADAPTILIVSNTGDSATPHQYAQWMREQMPTSVLVSREAAGHGAFGAGSDCLDDAVADFLADGTVPKDGLVCTD